MAHKLSDTGVYQSTITRTIDQHETVFQADLDDDGFIGLNLVSIETNGSYKLSSSNNKYRIIDSNDSIVTSFGNSNRSDGWGITQVEASASGGFEVLWSHTDGSSLVYKLSDTGEYKSPIFGRTIDQHEIAFQADLDDDGFIGLNLVSIETNGSYKLATSHNKYQIIDLSNNSIITSFDSSNMSDGWSATQVEASANGGFEVLWSHTDGRTMAHKLSDTGVYQSTITRTIDQHETVFQADLDDDGFIGLNLVSIETNGSYKLSSSNNKYRIIDSNDSIVTSFGNSNRSDGWGITQVEASASGGFEVLWSHTDGSSLVYKLSDTGEYKSPIFGRTIDQHEIAFQADLDDDGLTIETNGEFKIFGGRMNDSILGSSGNDTLDGGAGSDNITTGIGSDQIILRSGDGGNALSDADIITDFTDGSDAFGLTNGLSFGDLTRSQGTDDYANDSIISHGSEYLAILRNIDVSDLTEADFVNVDIA